MPILQEDFVRILKENIVSFHDHWLNDQQEKAAFSKLSVPLLIVAGPGTGKTTVLAVRILKLIFVEGYNPNEIMATTFTRKAASELRSRILSWGNTLLTVISGEFQNDAVITKWVNSIDINLIITGTIDSIAQDAIEDDRLPTEISPVIIDSQLARGIIRRNIIFNNGTYENPLLKQAIMNICGVDSVNVPLMIKSLLDLSERFIHDLVDIDQFDNSSPENGVLAETLRQYWSYLEENHMMDFALMEREFLNRIHVRRLSSIRELKAIFVDEFQDTNPLQEEIYYSICEQSGASLTVVGDDDQSIYRFRGATVEIFSQFHTRIVQRLGESWVPTRVDLVKNYRSTSRIVQFSNAFIHLDPDFKLSRTPGKQIIEPLVERCGGYGTNLPVLGMFRETIQDLSKDLTQFLTKIFSEDGFEISVGKKGTSAYTPLTVLKGREGNWGDAVLLSSTANDFTSTGRERLPRFLRLDLNNEGVKVFNPRGRSIVDIDEVAICLGILLLCIDFDSHILENTFPPEKAWARNAVTQMRNWRSLAGSYIENSKKPIHDEILGFVQGWATQTSSDGQAWPREWPFVELLFTIMRWIPMFQNDPEGQIYLEVLARSITTAGKLSKYTGNILFDKKYHEYSIKDIYQEVMLPIANGEIDVDEEIMPIVPRSYFPVMTIHQAKGLEFPLVIVDVGSDYKIDSPSQRFSRYPENGNTTHHIENSLSPHSQIGSLRLQRTELQRAFDDLRRLYFVANTRAQDVLLLVGLNKTIANNNIKLIQSGYISQDNICHINYTDSSAWTVDESYDSILLI